LPEWRISNSQFVKKSFGILSQNLLSASQKGNIYLPNCKKIKYLTPSSRDAKKYKSGLNKLSKNWMKQTIKQHLFEIHGDFAA